MNLPSMSVACTLFLIITLCIAECGCNVLRIARYYLVITVVVVFYFYGDSCCLTLLI